MRAAAPRISMAAPTPCPTAPTAATRPAGCDPCFPLHLARLLRTLRLSNFEPPLSPFGGAREALRPPWSRKTASFQPLACRGSKPGLTEAEAQHEDEKGEEGKEEVLLLLLMMVVVVMMLMIVVVRMTMMTNRADHFYRRG